MEPGHKDLSYGKQRALAEMRSIFSCQWANGMLPQIRFAPDAEGGEGGYRPGSADWGVSPEISGLTRLRTSGITQPPIMGLCLYEIFLKLSHDEQVAYFEELVALSQGVERFHAWLLAERDPWQEGLALCLHPWETGTDNSPAFEPLNEEVRRYISETNLSVDLFGRADKTHVPEAHRPTNRDYMAYFGLLALFRKHDYQQREIIETTPFLLQDVLFNSLLAASLSAHSSLQIELATIIRSVEGANAVADELRDGARESRLMYERVVEAIRRKLWSEEDGCFYNFDAYKKQPLRVRTVSGFAPLMSGIASQAQAAKLIERLSDPGQFWPEVPVPSTALDSPHFDPLRYWSGPSWPVTNWLLVRALRDHAALGGVGLSERLRQSTLRMIAETRSQDEVPEAAEALMEANSVGEEFTTPSRRQYQHGWLWDSAIVAVSWPLVEHKPDQKSLSQIEKGPGFWEYYHPLSGEPLGAIHMTWTASIYLELLSMGIGTPA